MARVLHTATPQDGVSTYVKAARERYSQTELATILGVDTRTLRRWEAGECEPPLSVIRDLKQLALPLPPDETARGDFTFIDLFAGIGGIRRAFQDIGGRCVYTSEWDKYAQKTYGVNFPATHSIDGDITKVAASEIPDHDVLLAGFPCQPFSIAGVSKKNALGRKHGFEDETQGTLFFDVARIIKEKQPRAFLLENVKNLLSHDKGRTFDVIKRTLTEELGYHIHVRVIDAAHFVPQHRERLMIVGFREPAGFDWAALKLPEKGAIKLATILHKTDGTEPELPWDEGRYFDHAKKRVSAKYTLSDHLWNYLQNYAEKHRAKGNGFGFGLVTGKDISRTLSARYHKDGSEILIKQSRKNPRRLTPRECARLMGFPDTFKIPVSDTQAYHQFSAAAVIPVVSWMAGGMKPFIYKPSSSDTIPLELRTRVESIQMAEKTNRWSREELLVAFNLYCQLPFGKLHKGNPEIIRHAALIGRTPSSVAMKLVNLASLDPAITANGRKGLGNASSADKAIWNEFHDDWEGLAVESRQALEAFASTARVQIEDDEPQESDAFVSYEGVTKSVIAKARVKQSFFRRAVLSSYKNRCCISGVGDSRLLIASHIVPWEMDTKNRLNPRNGLCLSALHDKAFDRGLITVTADYRVKVSTALKAQESNAFIRDTLISIEGKSIQIPEKFMPDKSFLKRHELEIFVH